MFCTFQTQPENKHIIFNCDEDGEILQSFLESELQEDLTYTSILLDQCKSQNISDFEFTGNSHTLLINKDKFKIENQFAETEFLTGERIYLIEILENWVAFLRVKSQL